MCIFRLTELAIWLEGEIVGSHSENWLRMGSVLSEDDIPWESLAHCSPTEINDSELSYINQLLCSSYLRLVELMGHREDVSATRIQRSTKAEISQKGFCAGERDFFVYQTPVYPKIMMTRSNSPQIYL